MKPGVFRHALQLVVLIALAACASIDLEYPRTESFALPPTETADTRLGTALQHVAGSYPRGQSGFYLLSDGIEALAARLVMAENAERSIDAQYYLIKDDLTGNAFVKALLDAADRGVRVRLLIDDMFTKGHDAGIAALDTHPNFEIRIFNPFARRNLRALDAIGGFSRINRRMHNKSYTVDNQVTVVGGRNIADEYFGARSDSKFGDLDVIGIGSFVPDVSAMFDEYWNHSTAIPVPGFADMPDDPTALLPAVRERLTRVRDDALDSPYAEAVRARALSILDRDWSEYTWAPYRMVVDSPDKGIKKRAAEADSITTPLVASLQSAQDEIWIVSPYFVPRKTGVQGLSEIKNRGVLVNVITNSLAANNQKTVHGGYAPSRKPLLQSGIRLYEIRADAWVQGAEIVAEDDARATLHTKAFIVDRRQFFIGSFNFDPRSAYINTELGVIIDSPKLAERVTQGVEAMLPHQAWEVYLDQNDKLRWRGLQDGQEVVLKKEPQTSGWDRFVAGFYRLLPIRGQL